MLIWKNKVFFFVNRKNKVESKSKYLGEGQQGIIPALGSARLQHQSIPLVMEINIYPFRLKNIYAPHILSLSILLFFLCFTNVHCLPLRHSAVKKR